MSNTFFNIFPNENFIDLCMYQFGYEQCDPGHLQYIRLLF